MGATIIGMGRPRNIALKLALIVMSVALAAFGVLGWAYAARIFDADWSRPWAERLAAFDPSWPIYVVAAIGCLAAQVIAACAVVNFARLAKAGTTWRALAIAFYIVPAVFAAYSADKGGQVVLAAPHRAAYEARENERTRLVIEITALNGVIEGERAKMSPMGSVGPQTRERETNAFLAATVAERERLPRAQASLDAAPSLPREVEADWLAGATVLAIFLAWALLEPWGYALAERGREAFVAPPVAERLPAPQGATQSANVHWFKRTVAFLTLGLLSHFATAPPASATINAIPVEPPKPIEIADWQDAKAAAFSMRDRCDVAEIAAHVKRDKSTVYRWFRERDKASKERTAA